MNGCRCAGIGRRGKGPAVLAALGACLFLWAAATSCPAAGRPKAKGSEYSVGQRVEIYWAGKWQEAEVVEIEPTGWIKANLLGAAFPMTPVLPPGQVRPAGSAPPSGEASDTSAGQNPFAARGSATATPRTWTDSTGKYQIEATLQECKHGQVTLLRTDGRTVTLPLEKLSAADQEFVKTAPQAESENPFEPGPASAAPATGNQAPAEMPLAPADTRQARQVVPGLPVGVGSLAPDPPPDMARLAARPISLAGKRGRFFEDVAGMALSPAGIAVIGHSNRPPGRQVADIRFELVNLLQGRLIGSQAMPENMVPLDVSPDGKLLLGRSNAWGFGKNNRLYVWQVDGGRLTPLRSWLPSDVEEGQGRDIQMAEWIDNAHALTLTSNQMLVLWDAARARAIWSLKLSLSARPAVSPGRKYVAAPTEAGLEIYDALTGDLRARLTEEKMFSAAAAFRPDGAQVAVALPQRLAVWDLAGGKPYREIALASGVGGRRIGWTDNQHVLLDGSYLVDVERRIVLWRYTNGASNGTGFLGGWYWYVAGEGDGRQYLVPVRLPHDEALKVAQGLDPEAILAIKPGTRASLEIDVEGPAKERDQIRQSLVAKLEENGVTVADGQPIKLVARTLAGKRREIEYRRFGAPPWGGGGEKASYVEQKAEVEYQVDGQAAWKAVSVSGAPPILFLKKSESVQSAMNKIAPSFQFFLGVHIPSHVVRPTGKTSYGDSMLTAHGLERVPSSPSGALPPRGLPSRKSNSGRTGLKTA